MEPSSVNESKNPGSWLFDRNDDRPVSFSAEIPFVVVLFASPDVLRLQNGKLDHKHIRFRIAMASDVGGRLVGSIFQREESTGAHTGCRVRKPPQSLLITF